MNIFASFLISVSTASQAKSWRLAPCMRRSERLKVVRTWSWKQSQAIHLYPIDHRRCRVIEHIFGCVDVAFWHTKKEWVVMWLRWFFFGRYRRYLLWTIYDQINDISNQVTPNAKTMKRTLFITHQLLEVTRTAFWSDADSFLKAWRMAPSSQDTIFAALYFLTHSLSLRERDLTPYRGLRYLYHIPAPFSKCSLLFPQVAHRSSVLPR